MYVAMHFAAAAQVLLLFRVQGSGVRDQSFRGTAYGIDSTMNSDAQHFIQNQEPGRTSKHLQEYVKLTPDP
jgi:hypothetical protein